MATRILFLVQGEGLGVCSSWTARGIWAVDHVEEGSDGHFPLRYLGQVGQHFCQLAELHCCSPPHFVEGLSSPLAHLCFQNGGHGKNEGGIWNKPQLLQPNNEFESEELVGFYTNFQIFGIPYLTSDGPIIQPTLAIRVRREYADAPQRFPCAIAPP